jgi:hypothetical protein
VPAADFGTSRATPMAGGTQGRARLITVGVALWPAV